MLQNDGHDLSQTLPALSFGLELSAALCRQPVKLCLTPRLSRTPISGQKILVFQAVKSRIKRALLDLQRFFRNHLNVLRNCVTVNRPERYDTKNEQVQRALGKFEFGWSSHACYFYIYTRTCRSARYKLKIIPVSQTQKGPLENERAFSDNSGD